MFDRIFFGFARCTGYWCLGENFEADATFFVFTGVIFILWVMAIIKAFSSHAPLDYAALIFGMPLTLLCYMSSSLVVHLSVATVLCLGITARAIFRLITNRGVTNRDVISSQVRGRVRTTTYGGEYLLGDKQAVYYWVWQIIIALVFYSYVIWIDFQTGALSFS